MGILLVSLGIGVLVGTVAGLLVGVIGGVVPGVIAAVASYLLLGRRVQRQLQDAMGQVQKEIQRRQLDAAVRMLEAVKQKVGFWQFFAKSSIDGQIGALYFLQDKNDEAKPYLENAFIRMWEPQGMLAVIHAKKKDYDAVDRVLERAAKYNPKQGLLWSLWAYIHFKAGHKDKAIAILGRGKDALGEKDPHIVSNLLALQNNKKMKMKGYGEPWYTFKLEQHPMLRQVQRGPQMRFARR